MTCSQFLKAEIFHIFPRTPRKDIMFVIVCSHAAIRTLMWQSLFCRKNKIFNRLQSLEAILKDKHYVILHTHTLNKTNDSKPARTIQFKQYIYLY